MDEPVEAARASFERLDALRIALEARLDTAVDSLAAYSDPQTGGFVHRLDPGGLTKASRASSATCVAFLVESGRWTAAKSDKSIPVWTDKALVLAETLGAVPWQSAELDKGNAFTVSFILDALFYLGRAHEAANGIPTGWAEAELPQIGEDDEYAPPDAVEGDPVATLGARIAYHRARLTHRLVARKGGLSIRSYPPTSFLTYKAVAALRRWGPLDDEARSAAAEFAWSQLYKESVNVASRTRDSDVFELAYSALVIAVTTEPADIAPAQRDAIDHALEQFFAAQSDAGEWPQSRSLFVYPRLGSAHCYDFELLTSLLQEPTLRPFLAGHEEKLGRAFAGLERTAVPLADETRAVAWASGHLNPVERRPESWATASVYHFCHELRRYVVSRIRDEVFTYARAARPLADIPAKGPTIGSDFLDSTFKRDGKDTSLKTVLAENFLVPLCEAQDRVRTGHSLPGTVPHSMILFGPPGTSKTQLAKLIAAALGWPLLSLDPSHVTRIGYDRLHAETNLLFTMLAACEEVVVLLDEFDELVQDRSSTTGAPSRFLTTAMLPKLAELAERRRIVYLLATNHLERFDDAISRAGRFDLVLPVLPPSLQAKRQNWKDADAKLATLAPDGLSEDQSTALEELTYLEFKQFVRDLDGAETIDDLDALIKKHRASSTMLKTAVPGENGADGQSWRDMLAAQDADLRTSHA